MPIRRNVTPTYNESPVLLFTALPHENNVKYCNRSEKRINIIHSSLNVIKLNAEALFHNVQF